MTDISQSIRLTRIECSEFAGISRGRASIIKMFWKLNLPLMVG
jgi:hypothetical protein